jgi:hypothetical protein
LGYNAFGEKNGWAVLQWDYSSARVTEGSRARRYVAKNLFGENHDRRGCSRLAEQVLGHVPNSEPETAFPETTG